jgi:hypothetical protein
MIADSPHGLSAVLSSVVLTKGEALAKEVDSSSVDKTTNAHQSARMKTVKLDVMDWGQIVDGLTCRAEQYELTAQYHETGFADGDILEANSAYEANAIAGHYREIIGKIRGQLNNG